MLRVVCLLSLVLNAYSATAPFIRPCNLNDAACIMSSATAAIPVFAMGVPQLGIKSMDPLHLTRIESNQGSLKMTFTDSMLTGLKNCKPESIKYDPVKMRQTIMLKCNLMLSGHYNIDGQLLVLPVRGNGRYRIDARDIMIKTNIDIAMANGNDGKPHWHIMKWKNSFNVVTGAKFDFENLFNGNKILAEPVLEFANANWKDVMQEIAPPIVDAIVAEVLNSVEALYRAVPFEELHLP